MAALDAQNFRPCKKTDKNEFLEAVKNAVPKKRSNRILQKV